MKKIPLQAAQTTLEALSKNHPTETAIHLLQTLFDQAQTHQQITELTGLFSSLSPKLLASAEVQMLYAKVLCRAREAKALLQYLDTLPSSLQEELKLYRAWALLRTDQPEQALALLDTLSTPSDQGLFWRVKGEAMHHLGQPQWHTVYVQAKPHLKGLALGRMLLDEGHWLKKIGQRAAARVVWSEALGYLRTDPYYLAWARHSLGIALIQDRPEEAETHLQEAIRISRKAVAKPFMARALCGLGSVRRSFGEWERALSSYEQAKKTALEPDDLQQALWGIGHTLRLLGRTEEAIGFLGDALKEEVLGSGWLYVDLAAARLLLDNVAAAREFLEQAADLGERERVIQQVLQALLQLRSGDVETARTALQVLPQNLWVREEVHCFPELQAFIAVPPPVRQYWVEVNPFGSLEVRVNGRLVPLSPTGRAGELLVYLLENGGSANLEMLLEDLYKDELKQPQKTPIQNRKALWANLEKLRQVLGWKQSVQVKDEIYRLDPQAQWQCRSEPKPEESQRFMLGHYGNWVKDRQDTIPSES